MEEGGEKLERSEYGQDVLNRLSRIEGQVKGIQKMIREGKNCVDILTQIAAVRAAINKVGGIVLEKHSRICLKDAFSGADKEKALEELVDSIQKFLKFVD